MRISDWSSDVCSSDLPGLGDFHRRLRLAAQVGGDIVRRRLVQAAEARGPHLHQRGQVRDCRTHLGVVAPERLRSEEHTSELQSLMRISYAVFCLKKKKNKININTL